MKILSRQDLRRGEWDAFCDESPAAWFWHREAWIRYCLAYADGRDLSFAVVNDGQLVGLCPLIHEKGQFSMGGDPCASPIGTMDVDCIDRLVRAYAVKTARFRTSPLTDVHAPHSPQALLQAVGYKDISWASRVVDLTHDEGTLWAALRKSYHSLIHRAEERLDCHGGFEERWRFAEYAALHQRLHGRRPYETYALQREWLTTGHAVVYTAWSKRTASIVGAAYFNLYKRAAYYGSAAYGEPDVACALIWHAMRDLKAHGVERLEMGWQGHAHDEKGKGVEQFKRGFGGRDMPLHCVEKRWL